MNRFNTLPAKSLRQLYLTLFLRGRSSRGLRRENTPRSVSAKLVGVLALYALVGLIAPLMVARQDLFMISLFLHTMGMLFTAMFVAASAGEILFNKDEAEILGHRPVDPRQLLWAKVYVLVKVSVLIALAYSVGGCVIVALRGHGSLLFPLAHLVSVILSALFGTGLVVLLYQLCMRFFGRERLDNLITIAQVFLTLATVMGSQMIRPLTMGISAVGDLSEAWWLFFAPSSWFAGVDQVLTGSLSAEALVRCALGLIATGTVVGFAFGKLASGMQEETVALMEVRVDAKKSYSRRGWLARVSDVPPLSWLLRHPVTRASFRLCVAYMVRDRDTKMRLYPGVAPVLAMPIVFLVAGMGNRGHDAEINGFALGLAGGYIGLVPLLAMNLLQFSQQWQASDVFRLGPASAPGHFIRGALLAIFMVLVVPAGVVLSVLCYLLSRSDPAELKFLLPGIIALPGYALLAGATARAVPLSRPVDEAKGAGRGLKMMLMMFSAVVLGSIGAWMEALGHFGSFLVFEVVVCALVCFAANASISTVRWDPAE